MDAETEVVPTGTEASERDGMDTDDGLDKLLRKAVTVSQANLPIAAIDKDIDDIASAYAKENERPEKAIDDDFVKLLERTRQRRELLDKKIGKGPDAAPRKRRSPLTEDLTSNVGGESAQTEDSPKRQCVREKESAVKPDTPAIASVKSRLQALSTQRAHWAEEGTENQGESSPVPTPRKSVAVSPPVEKTKSADQSSRTQPSSQRKSRFAQLASNISSWEDDLSHPSIVKEEEKKPRWQPPKVTENSASTQFSSAKASHDSIPTSVSEKSPKKPVSSVPSESVKLASGSPGKPGTKSGNGDVPSVKPSASSLPDSSKPAECQNVKEIEAQHEKESEPGHQPDVEESRSSRANTSRMEKEKEIEKHLEMKKDSGSNKQEETEREPLKSASHRREPETPKVLVPHTDRPLSARLANWEQKISDNKSDASCTPKTTVATPGRVAHPPKECTPSRLISTAPVEESEAVQMRPKTRRAAEDEPTAHSVSARMSAWEHISSAQVVSNIKKVNPGDCSPLKTPATQKSPSKNPTATPAKTCTKDGIKERIAQLNTPNKASNTPSKSQAVGSATKSAHWQPAQQSHCSDMAQRLRQERMAEVQGIQNRWKNGILKDDKDVPPAEPSKPESSTKNDKRQGVREKARADFQNKLATIGLDECNKEKAQDSEETAPKSQSVTSTTTSVTSTAVTGKPPRPTSLFTIVSQQKAEVAACSPRPVSTAGASKACRKVKFDDSFDSEDLEPPLSKKQTTLPETHTKAVADDSETNDEVEVVMRRPPPASRQPPPKSDDDDDVSLSAFVPRSVRFESILPSGSQDMDTSINSLDSFEGAPGAPPDFHKSTVDLVKLGQQYADSDTDTCSSPETADSTSQNQIHQSQTLDHIPQDMEESVDDREAIADLLDEAMDSDSDEAPSTSSAKPPVPVMRKKTNRTEAAGSGDLPFSINEYRASRNMQIQEVKQTIVRNSQYVGKAVKEEDVEMPSPVPTPAPRRSVQERIKELQELVQQEQSVIMQTSNALNQCCSSSSYFAGSSEQVECNRILLLSCQKRQAYMTEIQRLKDSSVLDSSGPGPKGSLTISDIRLPLKKEFVTKIGTSQDTMTYYFILLLKNGPQVISTQMLSTHDPMMRGSLDFPNLIKINGITGSFKLQLEIYSMSISCEASGKDKKKKTPKKIKGNALTVQSPGGPMAVRTTSFTQVTTVLLTMKSVDKHSFTLDRLSHLSPLHGTIYMNLKCLMEANVEEKGFLTMFEDVSGLGSWHRRWCALGGNKLQFWKYPDDETRKEPMGYIDLKRCVTEKVGLISRDICARPHTFELTTVRQPQKGEKDTLISRTYSTMTTVRHMLSADTKEERIVWCNKINRALATLRTWHADAMRPIPK